MSRYAGPIQPVFPPLAADPQSPLVGQTWFNTTSNTPRMCVSPGVVIDVVQSYNNLITPFAFPNLTSDPSNPSVGQTWFNTTTQLAKIKTSTGITQFTLGTPPAGLQVDNSVGQTITGYPSLYFYLTHAANVVAVLAVMSDLTPSSVYFPALNAMTLMGTPNSPPAIRVYETAIVAAGQDQAQINFPSSANYIEAILVTFTGSTSQAFEDTAYGSPQATSPVSQSIAAGTTGRMIVHACAVDNPQKTPVPWITLDSLLSLIQKVAVQGSPNRSSALSLGVQLTASGETYSDTWGTTGIGRTAQTFVTALKP